MCTITLDDDIWDEKFSSFRITPKTLEIWHIAQCLQRSQMERSIEIITKPSSISRQYSAWRVYSSLITDKSARNLTLWSIIFKIKEMGSDRVTLKIPRPLYDNIKTIIKESGFSSVNGFVVYMLRDLISLRKNKKELSPEEIDSIRQRLKNLGYF